MAFHCSFAYAILPRRGPVRLPLLGFNVIGLSAMYAVFSCARTVVEVRLLPPIVVVLDSLAIFSCNFGETKALWRALWAQPERYESAAGGLSHGHFCHFFLPGILFSEF